MSGTRRAFAKVALALPAAVALTACGGGGSGSPFVASSVPFERPVDDADYIGKTFPVFFLVGEAGDPSGTARAGKGTITYNSTRTVTVRLPGTNPIVFTRTGSSGTGTRYEGTAPDLSTVSAVVSEFASTTAFRLITSGDEDYAVIGGFGFETPYDSNRASATYQVAGAVFLTAENVEDFLPIAGRGELSADFGARTISGTLIDTDAFEVNLAGNETINDILDLRIDIQNGRITNSGFTGDLDVASELTIDGDQLTQPQTSVTGDSVEGAFFGGDAEAIAGTFEGDIALSDDDGPLIDFGAAGFVSGSKE